MKKIIALLCAFIMVCLLCMTFFSASATSYRIGDVDGDGSVTALDATIAQRVIARMLDDPDGDYKTRGDIDNDGSLTAVDVTLIMRYLARMEIPYPIDQTVAEPTETVTEAPTEALTEAPTQAPTVAPTQAPTIKTDPYELPPI